MRLIVLLFLVAFLGACRGKDYSFENNLYIKDSILDVSKSDLENLYGIINIKTDGHYGRMGLGYSARARGTFPIRDAKGYFEEIPMKLWTPRFITLDTLAFYDAKGYVKYGQGLDGNGLQKYAWKNPRRKLVKIDPRVHFLLLENKEGKRPSYTSTDILFVDIWDTPIASFVLSWSYGTNTNEQYEARSAGPDKIFYTDDDIYVSHGMPKIKQEDIKRAPLEYFKTPLNRRESYRKKLRSIVGRLRYYTGENMHNRAWNELLAFLEAYPDAYKKAKAIPFNPKLEYDEESADKIYEILKPYFLKD